MRKRHYIKIFTSTSFVFSLFALLVVFSSPASALTLSTDVKYIGGYNYPYWQSNNGESYKTGSMTLSNNLTYQSIQWLRLRTSGNVDWPTTGGDYVSIIGYVDALSSTIFDTTYNPASQASGFFGISSNAGGNDCQIVDFHYEQQEFHDSSEGYHYRYNFEYTCRVAGSGTVTNPRTNIFVRDSTVSGVSNVSVNIQRTNLWRVVSNTYDDTNLLAQLRTLNNAISTMNNKLDDIQSSLGTIEDYSLRSAEAQEQANDDANDRYQDEKDTINDAAQDAEDNASSQDFSFTIPNPLQSWFGGFSNNTCVNIPNLASWLHSNETQICSPWPSNVRSVMTTVVTGLVFLVFFGFIISWVKKNDTGGN